MFSFDKPFKRSPIDSIRKNTSVNRNEVLPIPNFNQETIPVSHGLPRLQKLPIQRNPARADATASQRPTEIQRTASKGVQGTGQRFPHANRIQKAFGHHDISNVKAYLGTQAIRASRLIGARAYATGNKVAFADSRPDLHTAAHEAAHIIQQRAGVHLKGGVGEAGDRYEQQADKVADNVVQGKSAESLLDSHAGSPGKGGLNRQPLQSQTAVQRAVGYEFETGWLVEVEESRTSRYFDPRFYYSKLKSRPLDKFKKRRPLKKKEKVVDFSSSDGFKIEADEAKHGKAELEFITYPPIKESKKGLKDLERVMKKMTKYGKQLEAKAQQAAEQNEKMEDGKEEVGMEMEPKEQPEQKKVEFSIDGINNKKFYITPPRDLKLEAGVQVTSGVELSVIPHLYSLGEKFGIDNLLKRSLDPLSSFPGEVPKDISPQLKGLLAVIVTYLVAGKERKVNKEEQDRVHYAAVGYPKQIGNTLLARTQFSKLFKLLPEEEQKRYRKDPMSWVNLVLTAAGNLDPKKSVIERGVREDDDGEKTLAVNKFKLTRYDWLINIPKNVDKLAAMKDAESLGEFKDKTEAVGLKVGADRKRKQAGIFEFRGAQSKPLTVDQWPPFAINFLKFIKTVHAKHMSTEK